MPQFNAQNAYTSSIRSTIDPRTAERRVLEQITARLRHAAKTRDTEFSKFAEALHDNLKLWLIFGGEAAREDNPMDANLRRQIFELAEFTRTQTSRVLKSETDVEILLEINENIIAGLRGDDAPLGATANPELSVDTTPSAIGLGEVA